MKIFDSLTHPTLDQTWNEKSAQNSFENLAREMKQAGIPWACAVGLEGVGQYEAEAFAAASANFPFLFPVAGIHPLHKSGQELRGFLQKLKKLGYCGLKIHPRFSQLNLQRDFAALLEVAQAAADLELPVFFCTYYACSAPQFPDFDPLQILARLVAACPKTKFILVHGGTVRLLEYMELVRFNPNLLLDLSLTLMKYEGSSIDLDLNFLFRKFDQRICVGSDHPEWPLEAFRRRVEGLCQGLDDERIRRITHGNLAAFLGITL